MSLPKEPRQLMINLMYLVLTAMLALNITKEVLNAFMTIDSSIVRSNESITDKNNEVYAALAKAAATPAEAEKAAKWNQKALLLKTQTADLITYLGSLKDSVINKSGGWEMKDSVRAIKNIEDINIPTEMFVTKKVGDSVKSKLQGYINFINNIIEDPEYKKNLATTLPLRIVDPKRSEDNSNGDWVYGNFHNIPVIASVALLSKFQNDLKNSEGMILDHLLTQIHRDDYQYDALTAIAVPTTSYALEGQDMEASVMLVAYNKSANPTITSSMGAVPVKDGVGMLKFKATGTGAKTVNGVISIQKGGATETYPFKFEYTVGSAGASMQLDKMNVMYIGVPNPISLSASGYNIQDVSLSMPGATLTDGADGGRIKGHYTAMVSKLGTLAYSINAKTRAGGTAVVQTGKVRVKYIPKPTAEIMGRPFGLIPTGEAKASPGVVAALKDFDFDTRFQVKSFRFVLLSPTGSPKEVQNNSAIWLPEAKALIERSKAGDKWSIENITALGPDGRVQNIGSMLLTLN